MSDTAEHQLRNNTSRALTIQHKHGAYCSFHPRIGSLCGHCQSSGVEWGHVARGGVGNGMAASGVRWLLDSRVVQPHSRKGNTVLLLQDKQMHGEMKELSQGQNVLLEIGQGCYSLPPPAPKRNTCETEEGEEEIDGLFLMNSFWNSMIIALGKGLLWTIWWPSRVFFQCYFLSLSLNHMMFCLTFHILHSVIKIKIITASHSSHL